VRYSAPDGGSKGRAASEGTGTPLAFLVLLASAYQFCQVAPPPPKKCTPFQDKICQVLYSHFPSRSRHRSGQSLIRLADRASNCQPLRRWHDGPLVGVEGAGSRREWPSPPAPLVPSPLPPGVRRCRRRRRSPSSGSPRTGTSSSPQAPREPIRPCSIPIPSLLASASTTLVPRIATNPPSRSHPGSLLPESTPEAPGASMSSSSSRRFGLASKGTPYTGESFGSSRPLPWFGSSFRFDHIQRITAFFLPRHLYHCHFGP